MKNKKAHRIKITTVNGVTDGGFFPDIVSARRALDKEAARINERSEGKTNSFKVTAKSLNSLTIGVIAGNPEAIRMEVI